MTERPRGNVVLDGLDEERRLLIERLRGRRTGPEGASTDPVPAPAGDRTAVVPRISLFFFSADTDDNVRDKHDLVLECAERADALGLDAVWVPERHFNAFGAPYPSPGLLLAAIAARTRRIALRAGSVVLPLHDPLLVAEEWGVLDSLSRGRTGISLASGWHTDDFVLNPEGYEERKQVLEEGLAELRTLWAGGSVVRPGPGGRPVEVRTHPRPQRSPEVWLTSSGNPETWRTAGRLNLHVLTALLEQPLKNVAEHVRLYHEALAEAGHRPTDRTVTCMLHTHLAADPDAVAGRVRGPLGRYLQEHMSLFTKFAAGKDIGVRPEDVSEADRKALVEHGLRRYMGSAGLFGSAESCLPFVDRLVDAGINELGCLVDFGLSRAEVLESVDELGRLRALLERR